jgi:hypothetical protein
MNLLEQTPPGNYINELAKAETARNGQVAFALLWPLYANATRGRVGAPSADCRRACTHSVPRRGAGERVTFGDLLDIERQEAELVWKAQGASR